MSARAMNDSIKCVQRESLLHPSLYLQTFVFVFIWSEMERRATIPKQNFPTTNDYSSSLQSYNMNSIPLRTISHETFETK